MSGQAIPSKEKKLASNILLFSLTMLLPKLLSFFLVPVYTAYLTTEEYGISDLILNTNSLILPIFSLGINNAVLLFTIENKGDAKPYHVGLRHWIISTIALMICLASVRFFFEVNTTYLLFVLLIYSTNALSDVQIAYLKSQEEMRLISICTIGGSFVSIFSNIITIVVLQLGVYGFLISTSVGYLFQVVFVAVYTRGKNLYKNQLKRREMITQDMYKYSVPLVSSSISWWLYSASDRYFVTSMISAAENGIYAVAYKIPNMLQIVQNIFSQAWFFSLFDLYKTEEGRRYIGKIYDLYSFVMCFSCGLLIAADVFLARLLYSNDFFTAWRYVPPLLISIVFTALATFLSTFLMAHKRSDLSAKIAIATSIINCIMNYTLIKMTGSAFGAAVSTALTAAINWVFALYYGRKFVRIEIKFSKHIGMFFLLIIESIVMIYMSNTFICIIILIVIFSMNTQNCGLVLEKVKQNMKKINTNRG